MKIIKEDLEFLDMVTLKPTVSLDVLRDGFADAVKKTKGKKKPVLEVTFEATHAGVFQKRKTSYLPTEMSAAVPTWLSPFSKPVLKHHNDSEDPIGRIKSAVYVDTSDYFRSKYPHLTPILLPNTSIEDKVKIAGKIIRDIYDKDENYKGLGFVKLTTEINDESAIEKFLDKRYLTPSTYFVPKDVRCSICGKSVLSDKDEEPCEHGFGDVSPEGVPFFLVPVGFENREVSVVNIPGDKHAKATGFRMLDSLTDVYPILRSIDDNSTDGVQVFTVYKDSMVEIPQEKEEIEMRNKKKQEQEKLEQKVTIDNEEVTDEEIEEEVADSVPATESTETVEETEEVEVEEEVGVVEEEEVEENLSGHEPLSRTTVEEFLLKFKNNEEKVEDKFGADAVTATLKLGPYDTFPADTRTQVETGLSLLEGFEDSETKEMLLESLQKELEKFVDEAEETDSTEDVLMSKINDMIDLYASALPGEDEELVVTEEEVAADAEKVGSTKNKDKKGGSNAGKYSKAEGPFCGPSGGAPKGTYPVNTLKRAQAALRLSSHAPNPSGVRACVYRHWPKLKKDAKDNDELVGNIKQLVDLLKETPEENVLSLKDNELVYSFVETVDRFKDTLGIKDEDFDKSLYSVKIDLLKTQLINEKNSVKSLIEQIAKMSENTNEENEEVDLEEKNEEEKKSLGFKDADLSNIEELEDPTLTRDTEKMDNSINDKKPATYWRKEYAGFYRKYQDLKRSGKEAEAYRYLDYVKYNGFLPTDAFFD